MKEEVGPNSKLFLKKLYIVRQQKIHLLSTPISFWQPLQLLES